MKHIIPRATFLLALAAAACAASGAQDSEPEATPSPGPTTLPEGGGLEEASVTLPIEREHCSAAGWCTTELPDIDLRLSDVWPLEARAFALADSPRRGVKVMEWSSATSSWAFIDDGTQNDFRVQPAGVWAPNDDEVYFALLDYEAVFVGGNTVMRLYRGKRPVAPATAWIWTKLQFDCDLFSFALPTVGGTSSSDVYFTACRTIYRLGGEVPDAGSGTPWPAEFVDDDPTFPVKFLAITGSTDDVWFVGMRDDGLNVCTVLVRKTATGYERVADSVPDPDGNCVAKDGLLSIKGAFESGIQSVGKGIVVGARTIQFGQPRDITRIAALPNGDYSIETTSVPSSLPVDPSSVWGVAGDDLWALGSIGAAESILRGTNVWSDAGTYGYSTLAINGAPNTTKLWRLRGTSNTNLWAVGYDRAFHKSTP